MTKKNEIYTKKGAFKEARFKKFMQKHRRQDQRSVLYARIRHLNLIISKISSQQKKWNRREGVDYYAQYRKFVKKILILPIFTRPCTKKLLKLLLRKIHDQT